jgi:DNA-directed RNA polymerase specialized sigma24 family protein
LESHLRRFDTNERRLLLKQSAIYAARFKQRVCGESGHITIDGEEILRLTLARMGEGVQGYEFRDGDILLLFCLCRCCRKTVLDLYREANKEGNTPEVPEEAEDAPLMLTEGAAATFLKHNGSLDQFLAFAKGQGLSGKLRPYAQAFPRYAELQWSEAQIAKELRVTADTVATYRTRLRDLIEEFELQRMRRRRG